jgi:hypothetical protein
LLLAVVLVALEATLILVLVVVLALGVIAPM